MFFFHFCNFGRRPRFPDTGVTQTVTQTGQKCALAQLFRAKAFLLFGIIFCFQIAAVRTFSIALAASFCAAVVTWA